MHMLTREEFEDLSCDDLAELYGFSDFIEFVMTQNLDLFGGEGVLTYEGYCNWFLSTHSPVGKLLDEN